MRVRERKEIQILLREAKMKLEECRGLCHRCENRVRFIESDGAWQPRMECGDIKHSSCSCYAYLPVKPIILRKSPGDTRQFGYRTAPAGIGEYDLKVKTLPRKRGKAIQWVRYWEVK